MNIIIVGAGRLGSLLAKTLSSTHYITIIDQNQKPLDQVEGKVTKILGLGFDQNVLLQAKINEADALYATTSDDATNALIARIAKEFFRVPIVVARLYNPKNAQIYSHLGIRTISIMDFGVEKAISLLDQNRLSTISSFGHNEVEIIQTNIPNHLVGHLVKEIEIPYEIRVNLISRLSHSFIPSKETPFEKDDLVVITVMRESKEKLKAFLGRV